MAFRHSTALCSDDAAGLSEGKVCSKPACATSPLTREPTKGTTAERHGTALCNDTAAGRSEGQVCSKPANRGTSHGCEC